MSNLLGQNVVSQLSWHIVACPPDDLSLTSTDHNLLDPALTNSKSLTLTIPMLGRYGLLGYTTVISALGEFISDPGSLYGQGLNIQVKDATKNSTYHPPISIGGLADNPGTGQPPAIGVTTSAAGLGTIFGELVIQPQMIVYTTGHAIITGNIDIRQSASPGLYGVSGSLDGASFDVFTEQGPITIVSSGSVINEDDLINLFDLAANIGMFVAYDSSSGFLTLWSHNETSDGEVGIIASSIVTELGFSGGASATDGVPTFGELDSSVLLDAVVSIFIAPVHTMNI